MKNPIHDLISKPLAVIAVGAMAFAASPAVADTQGQDGAQAQGDLQDAMASIKEFSIEQRDTAVEQAQALIDGVDADLERLQARVEENWSSMSEDARQKANAVMEDLRKKRTDAVEWLGGLKHSSKETWKDVKSGFVEAYENTREAVTSAVTDAGDEPSGQDS